jgi:hypothetical protein
MAAQGLVVNALVMSTPPKVTVVAAVTKATAQATTPPGPNLPLIVGELPLQCCRTLAASWESGDSSHLALMRIQPTCNSRHYVELRHG